MTFESLGIKYSNLNHQEIRVLTHCHKTDLLDVPHSAHVSLLATYGMNWKLRVILKPRARSWLAQWKTSDVNSISQTLGVCRPSDLHLGRYGDLNGRPHSSHHLLNLLVCKQLWNNTWPPSLSLSLSLSLSIYIYIYIYRVGSRFTTRLRSRIFGCKSNRRKTGAI